MKINAVLVILACIVRSLTSEEIHIDGGENLKSPISNEIKQYVFNVLSIMAEKHFVEIEDLKKVHNNDISNLRTMLTLQEERISTLENDKEEYSNKLSELQNQIIQVIYQDDIHQKQVHRSNIHKTDVHQRVVHQKPIHRNDTHLNDVHKDDIHQKQIHHNDTHLNDVHQGDIHQKQIHHNYIYQNDVHQDDVDQNQMYQKDTRQVDVHKNGVHQKEVLQAYLQMNDVHQDDVDQKQIYQKDTRQVDVHKNGVHPKEVLQDYLQKDNVQQSDVKKKDAHQIGIHRNNVHQGDKGNAAHTESTFTEKAPRYKMQFQDRSQDKTRYASPVNDKWRLRRAGTVNKVAFFATMTPYLHHLGKDQDIVFDHVVTNIGNGYNGHHGTFVAPVSGTYVFSVTLLSDDAAFTWGHFVVNGVVLAKLEMNQSHEHATQMVIVNLRAGDDVSVQNTETDRGYHGDSYNTFSGFLLY